MQDAHINFIPPLWMRSAMVQTGLASLKFRKRGITALERKAQTDIMTTPDGVKLKAVTSESEDETRPVFIFIHGWEGSSESTYVVAAARRVFEKGCAVVRLNLRDHGDTHALNEGAFYATLFDEVFDAVEMICGRYKNRPVILTGFSLGGNYTLRVARRLAKSPIDNLAHLIAVSPVIDPPSSNPSLDNNRIIRSYFLKKWKRSMQLKQAAFPELYNFDAIMDMTDIMAMTEIVIPQYTDYADAMTYFSSYALGVVPMALCKTLVLNSQSQLLMWRYGGHNGFFKSLTGPTGYDDVIAHVLESF